MQHCLTPEDAGLQIKNIEATDEVEVSTERVFLENKVAETLQKLPGAQPMLTYFVNDISLLETRGSQLATRSIPYSFVSTLVSGLVRKRDHSE